MRSTVGVGLLLLAFIPGACSTPQGSAGSGRAVASTPGETAHAGTQSPAPPAAPGRRTLLVDTDVAADDLIALAFLVASPRVSIAGITVSGTGEAHCGAGVDVVLALLDRLEAPDIPVTCGRETPLAGAHTFPEAWREHVDAGSGLQLEPTARTSSQSSAVQLIADLAKQHGSLTILTLGPLTNLGDALQTDADLATLLGPVFVMGGALHVPGNLVCCGAPAGNAVAEWNIYVDPHAAQVVVESGISPYLVPLDGTNQVPVTTDFTTRALAGERPAARVLADLFAANDFMTSGSYYLWDPLAAMLAAGYPVGTFTPARVKVEEAEGPESGFTRPVDGDPNVEYLSTVDAGLAEATLLGVLNGE